MAQIIALIGPTAVGKTDVSIELAKRLNAEIIGCDSMQVYRGMAALTQQPTAEQRARVPHHLIDHVDPSTRFTVAEFRRQALETIDAIQGRGRTPLLVGGTGLYLRALRRGLCDAPKVDAQLREELQRRVKQEGPEALHHELQQRDPQAAAKIHPNDARRIVRALEVYELTGEPLSSRWQQTPDSGLPIDVLVLDRDRAELHQRINDRVVKMFDDADVRREVRALDNIPLSDTAAQSHGLAFLRGVERGELEREQAITLWQQQVRQYARRQLIWFRREPGARWLTIAPDNSLASTVESCLTILRQPTTA